MDIVERLREQANVAENWLQRPQAVMADTMNEAAATIEALRAELAGRDAEIAAWLRGDAAKMRQELSRLHAGKKLTPMMTAEWEAMIHLKAGLADAIASGQYRQGEEK